MIIILTIIIAILLFTSTSNEALAFDIVTFKQLKKLWPEEAKNCPGMKAYGVDLFDYEWISTPSNANRVLDALESGHMPPNSPWPQEKIDVYRAWIKGGMRR